MTEVDQRPSADEPPGDRPDAAVKTAARPEPQVVVEPNKVPPFLTLVKRLPFTSAYVVITLVLSIAFGTLWSRADQKGWFHNVAYGLPSFSAGRWWTLVTGNFFALYPVYYIFVVGAFALLTGFAEWKLGTLRTLILTTIYQFVGVLVVALIFLIFRNGNWEWAAERSTELDVGFSAGMLAVVGIASATVRPPWRLRLRLAIWVYVLFSILYVGQMADAEHVVAVLFSLPFSTRLAGPRALKARALPTRHEVRLLAMVGIIVIAGSLVIGRLLPDRLTIFGPSDDSAEIWWVFWVELLVAIVIANGLRKGYRLAWWFAVVLACIPLLFGALVVVLAVLAIFLTDLEVTIDGLPQFTSDLLLWLAFLLLLLLAKRAFQVPRRGKRKLVTSTSHPETAQTLIRRWGGSTLSWMTTWPENRHMLTEDGESFLAFRKHAGVAIALGDPVGPPGSARATMQNFVDLCERTALVPYVFSCTDLTADVAREFGWQVVQVAEDNLMDLADLEFKGKKWQDVRTAINKAPKEGISFQMVTLADETWSLVRQVEHLSEEWLGDKGLPEMGFTLGGVQEALDPATRVGLALDAEGVVHGVTSWMPVYGGEDRIVGWTLDLMRRKDGGFRQTMEFLIASSAMYFKAEGAEFISLSGAPLARSEGDEAAETAIDRFLDTLGASLEPVYGFRSLHAFKSKFQPRRQPMYMLYRDEADLPRIGIAITRAYLPNAKIRELIAVVRH